VSACLLGHAPLLAGLSICRTKIYTLVSAAGPAHLPHHLHSNPFSVTRCCTWQKKIQPPNGEQKCSTKEQPQNVETPLLLVDPYAADHRRAMIESKSVQGFMQAQGSLVALHSRKLPRLPLANTTKRQFKKPTVVRLGDVLTLEVTGLLGSGGFAHVFAATALTDRGKTATDVAIKVRSKLCIVPAGHISDNNRGRCASMCSLKRSAQRWDGSSTSSTSCTHGIATAVTLLRFLDRCFTDCTCSRCAPAWQFCVANRRKGLFSHLGSG